jgi:hypothetical protein
MIELPSIEVLIVMRQCTRVAPINYNATPDTPTPPEAIQAHRLIADALDWIESAIIEREHMQNIVSE